MVRWVWETVEVWERDGGFEAVVEVDAGLVEVQQQQVGEGEGGNLVGFGEDMEVSVDDYERRITTWNKKGKAESQLLYANIKHDE
ncbi:hypothetical protein MGYG_04583 [Nannizzia gypsea CBS 118893]|uniref:Uncharacterized protein n=1 Tax=Arthroderma gypseum (strain ATCC MYA-4604 / CBS 118893) TaxID=535722 RepID=E4UTT7_ARTGP|nr:hypothetical protein MGYG_04583 [Nannizzia gypsea CBS 118893]EFR01580.1 hypothetical protein MGYG_04583 [Nannizzia gypsea CBS 118893]